jgi:DMSO/TMAO reductase YedYZ molybdopterin-dependent catalytic subunit
MITRRDFLCSAAAALAARKAAHPLLAWAQEGNPEAVPGKEGMILRSYRFLDLETPVESMNTWITPVSRFYVRNHMHMPVSIDAGSWKLTIGGEVEKTVTVTLADLNKLPQHSVTSTMECAGNGRSFQRPIVPGVQWQRGAVGNARFSGPRMHDILQHAGVKATGKHVRFRGLDMVPGKVPPFIRSIPIEKAMDPDTLIATHMNGAPLSKYHGFPARAVVPGWIGAASCKWITEITLLEKEFDGNFMKPGYRFPNHAVEPGGTMNPEDTHAITTMIVKSVITGPTDGAVVKPGAVHVQGVAWAGEAEIAKVDISTDAGATWQPARLGADHARYAWRLWSYAWKPDRPGEYVILSRATDSKDQTQPDHAAWNPSGYLYNAIDRVTINVQA